jgi:serine/threonine protein kinase
MGSVWLAEDMQLDNKLFAIKMLPSILVSNKRAYKQLKDEALVSMRLTHPNIVTLRAFEENNGNPFLVMDYIDGETLDDWLVNRMSDGEAREDARPPSEDARPPEFSHREAKSLEFYERPRAWEGERPREPISHEADVVRLLKPIAEALDYAHTEGVVHRDVKPANVMIRKDGRPFIMDFGIAREIQETMTRVTGKMSSGTLMYMSPEQLNGDVPKPSQDVYSFAAMVYECLKGEPPFSRGNIEYQIMNKEPEPLTNGRASVPAGRASVPASHKHP